jgi:hypothetical protein
MKQISMSPMGFKPAIRGSEGPQALAFDRSAIGINIIQNVYHIN